MDAFKLLVGDQLGNKNSCRNIHLILLLYPTFLTLLSLPIMPLAPSIPSNLPIVSRLPHRRPISQVFKSLPDRNSFPEYYKIIPEPMSLDVVKVSQRLAAERQEV